MVAANDYYVCIFVQRIFSSRMRWINSQGQMKYRWHQIQVAEQIRWPGNKVRRDLLTIYFAVIVTSLLTVVV